MMEDKGGSGAGGTNNQQKDQLNLRVVGQDGQVVQFKIKRNTPLKKLIQAYCDRCRMAPSTLRFMFDGNRIDEGDTPKSMDMDEGDTIEVFTQQTGGRSTSSTHFCTETVAAPREPKSLYRIIRRFIS